MDNSSIRNALKNLLRIQYLPAQGPLVGYVCLEGKVQWHLGYSKLSFLYFIYIVIEIANRNGHESKLHGKYKVYL